MNTKKLIKYCILTLSLAIIVACSTPQNSYNNYTIIYFTSNGSLPPPYGMESTFTASKDNAGIIKAQYETSNYDGVLETREVKISDDQFKNIITGALLLDESEDELEGCTGGSSESLQISEGEKTIIDLSNYNCGGKSTNQSLKDFSTQIEELI